MKVNKNKLVCNHAPNLEQTNANKSDAVLNEQLSYDLAELFKLFGDSTRIKILFALFESERCVCDIANLLGMSQSAISHQLRGLKKGKLVNHRREGKTMVYSLADDHVYTIISQGVEHVTE